MNSSIWASLDDFMLPDHKPGHVGLNYANHYFMRALFRYGTFDAYHFFLINAPHCRNFEKHWGPWLADLGIIDRVHLYDRLQLNEMMTRHDYQVFHLGDQMRYYASLCRLRTRLGAAIPITAFIHSLSGQQRMDAYLSMLADGPTAQDAIICSSTSGKKVIEKRWQAFRQRLSGLTADIPLPVIPLGIDEQPQPQDRAAARQHFGFDPQEVIGLCFGRFSDTDKMDLFPLLQSFAEVTRHSRNSRLIIAGALNQQSYFEMVKVWVRTLGLEARVTLLTNLSETDKHLLYDAVDLFISVADNPQETFGLTLLEAMFHGLPLVVSDFDGYRDLVPATVGVRIATSWAALEELGQLHAVCDEVMFHRYLGQSIVVDVRELTAALLLMVRAEGLRQKMGAAAREHFEANFAHRKIIGRLEELWRDLKSQMPAFTAPPPAMFVSDTQAFSHYVTRILSGCEQVRATPFSTRLADMGQTYPQTFWMDELIDSAIVSRLLDEARQPVTIQELEKADARVPGWRMRYMILWMLKHDLLEMV